MDTLTRNDLDFLARHRAPWSVSIYLPTDRSSNGMLQNPIRLKNLINQAEDMLVDHGLEAPAADKYLRPVRELLDQREFWNGVSEGLAIFVDAEGARTYRLPQQFAELVFVGKRFHIKPLLPLCIGDGKFFLLAMSGNLLRMYEGDRRGLTELSVPELPENMAAALNYDQPPDVRQVRSGAVGGRYRTNMSYHGQGGGPYSAKAEMLEFMRIVDRSMKKHLANEQSPLVFAGVEYLFPIFKDVCSYSHLASEHIVGNTDTWNHDQLHAAAWAVVEPLFTNEVKEAVARSRVAAGTDYGLLQLERVLQACSQGQVDTLLVDLSQCCWGTFDVAAGTVHQDVEARPGNEELLDLAVTLTLENRGKVFPASRAELPDQSPLVALLRYPSTATPIPRMPKRIADKV